MLTTSLTAKEEGQRLRIEMMNVQQDTYICLALPVSLREIAGIAARIASETGMDDSSLDILVTHDSKMQELNKLFLNLEGPTNVLSFPAKNEDSPDFLGQLVINADAIIRESWLYGQDTFEYLTRLLIHGMLHLAGLEHGEEMDVILENLISEIVNG